MPLTEDERDMLGMFIRNLADEWEKGFGGPIPHNIRDEARQLIWDAHDPANDPVHQQGDDPRYSGGSYDIEAVRLQFLQLLTQDRFAPPYIRDKARQFQRILRGEEHPS